MKKRIILLLLVLLLLSGCAGEGGGMPFDLSAAAGDLLATETATYYLGSSPGGDVTLIYARGGDQTDFVPLCGKPNCTHSDRSCNAYAAAYGLGYFNDRLYTLVGSDTMEYCLELVSLRPDGTDRKAEAGIPWRRYSDGHGEGPFRCVFHNGRLILLYQPDESVPIEEQTAQIWVLDLNTKKFTQPFADSLSPMMRLENCLRPAGSCIYDRCEYRSADGSTQVWLVEMDLNTGKVRKLFQPADETVYDSYYLVDGALAYLEPGVGFLEYDLKTGKTVDRGLPVEDLRYAYRSGDLILAAAVSGADPGHTIWFLDGKYRVLDSLTLPEGMRYCGMDGQYLYFRRQGEPAFCASLDRSAIGTGTLTLEELGTPTPAAPEKEEPVTAMFPTAPVEGLPMDQGMLSGYLVRPEQGVYFMDQSRQGLICRIPRGETAILPVCGQPDCDHTGADCGARVPGLCGLGWFRERLYLACREGEDLAVYVMDPGSGARTPVQVLRQPRCVPNNVLFHENALLVEFVPLDEEADPEEYHIQLLDLPSGQVCQLCRDFLDQEYRYTPNYIQGPFYGCGSVFLARAGNEVLDEHGGYAGMETWSCEIDLTRGTVRRIPLPADGMGLYVTPETVYYVEPRGDFCEYDRAAGTVERRPGAEENAGVAYYEEDLIVLRCEPSQSVDWEELPEEERTALLGRIDYYFLDRDYNKLDELHVTDMLRYAFATEDALYFYDQAGGCWYIPRGLLGTGALEPIPAA